MALGANEQYLLELINITRENPTAELDRIVASRSINAEISNNLNFFHVNLEVLRSEVHALAFSQWPLAWNDQLANAALGHSQLMQQNQLQTPSHQLPGEPDSQTRIINSGYDTAGGWAWAENLPAILTDLLAAHASMLIDWGSGPDGMERGRGHRINMLTKNLPNPCAQPPGFGSYDEIGIGVVSSDKMYITQDFGYRCNRDSGHGYVVGVVFRNINQDGVYSMGSGVGGVTLQFQSRVGTATTTTNPWGGYQILLESADWIANVAGPGINTQFGFFNTGRVNKHLNFVISVP
jgi:hypothetical protein